MEQNLLRPTLPEGLDQIEAHRIFTPIVGFSIQHTNFTISSVENVCADHKKEVYSSILSVTLAVPEWEAVLTSFILSLIIVLTIVGNILVILSVFTYKPLRIAQNFFIVSLAVADLAVAILVLPFNVAYSLLGRWEFGIIICKVWLTSDVMCCTSSILNLCGIALDRFWAITDPINYAHKRTMTRVLLFISGIWLLSFLISSPPLFGWNDWPTKFTSTTPCELTSNRGYVVYSALGSFFIPLSIMTFVYFQIYVATKRRLRERAQALKVQKSDLNMTKIKQKKIYVDVHNFDHCTCCGLQFICCLRSAHHKLKTTVTEEKEESFSSDTQINSDNYTESLKKKANETSTCINTKNSQQGEIENNQELRKECRTRISTFPPQKKICCSTKLEKRSRFDKKPAGMHQFVEERQKISLCKERRAARTLGIIMGVFVICWLPFFLMYVILPFCKTCCPTPKLKNFITWLGYINSSLNPILYTIFNIDYRRAFKKLLGLK